MTGRAGCCCFIVPPFLLEDVARRGGRRERELALATLSVDHTVRSLRLQSSLAGPRLLDVLAGVAPGRPRRTIYDAQHREDRDARAVVRAEGQPAVSDEAVNQAYDGLGDTYRFYWDVFRRDSIDDGGLALRGEVHFGIDYDNAFWDGHRMMFGDGDGRLFLGFTKAVDVIGHELAHGVTQDTLGLFYLGQPGALNESCSDVFGSMVKQYALGQTAAEADWLIADGVLGPALHGQALRSMKAPGTAFEGDRQPAEMAAYVHTTSDNGGVHLNSGIPNRAFYLAATKLGGHSWERAGQVWYQVLVRREVGPNAQFHAFAEATVRVAGSLYGTGSEVALAIAEAWAEVGIEVRAPALAAGR